MNALRALNPWYMPGLGDYLHRSAMQGHTPELFNNLAISPSIDSGAGDQDSEVAVRGGVRWRWRSST